MTGEPPVVARALVKRYGELVAVDHVDLTVERGDVFGYLGPTVPARHVAPDAAWPDPAERRVAQSCSGGTRSSQGARALEGVAGFVEGPGSTRT